MWNLKPYQWTVMLCYIKKLCLMLPFECIVIPVWFCCVLHFSLGKYWFTELCGHFSLHNTKIPPSLNWTHQKSRSIEKWSSQEWIKNWFFAITQILSLAINTTFLVFPVLRKYLPDNHCLIIIIFAWIIIGSCSFK